jgi:hypothetical protein
METYRQKQVLCRKTLAPAVAKDMSERTLRAFHAPTRGNERESDTLPDHRRHSGLLKQQVPTVMYYNPLQRVQKMTSATLTDADAERLVYPFHASAITIPFEQVLVALMDKLRGTVAAVTWNTPQTHPTWETDLRFFGQWWLVLRTREESGFLQASADQHPSGRQTRISWVQGAHGEPLLPISTTALLRKFHDDRKENRYAPLLPRGAGSAQENQLIADLARRLAGPTDHLDLFHLSGLCMTADRLHVLLFDGFSRLADVTMQRATEGRDQRSSGPSIMSSRLNNNNTAAADNETMLSTLSLSSCQMGSAGLVVLLTGVAALAAQGVSSICTLDLSYNNLQSASLYALMQLLRFTYISRLSLRGNNLASVDVIPFREFLLEGCEWQLEELDLSYTGLTAAQVNVLIEALPRLKRLRVLLLEEVAIPSSKWPSLARAVERTQLWHLRLVPSTALSTTNSSKSGHAASVSPVLSSIAPYIRSMDEVCARNAQRAAEASGADAASVARNGFFGFNTVSFFEAFFRYSLLRAGTTGEGASALPEGYRAFTSNDPSLP